MIKCGRADSIQNRHRQEMGQTLSGDSDTPEQLVRLTT